MDNGRVSTKILIIEDDPNERVSLQAAIEASSLKDVYVEAVESGAAAESLVKVQFFDVLIVDYRLPDVDGLTLIKKLKEIVPDMSPIVCTGYSSIEIAVNSMKMGAYDYMIKPIKVDMLIKSIEDLLKDKDAMVAGKKKLVEMLDSGDFKYKYSKDNEISIILAPNTDILLDTNKIDISNKLKSFFGAVKKYYWG